MSKELEYAELAKMVKAMQDAHKAAYEYASIHELVYEYIMYDTSASSDEWSESDDWHDSSCTIEGQESF